MVNLHRLHVANSLSVSNHNAQVDSSPGAVAPFAANENHPPSKKHPSAVRILPLLIVQVNLPAHEDPVAFPLVIIANSPAVDVVPVPPPAPRNCPRVMMAKKPKAAGFKDTRSH